MNDYGELLDKNTVRFERLLPGPIERVWAFLTESDKRAQWLCGGDVETGQDLAGSVHEVQVDVLERSEVALEVARPLAGVG